MKPIQSWLDEYGESHQNPLNKKIHWVCVPAIMFSIIGLLWSIPHHYMPTLYDNIQLNWAMIITIIILTFYIKLSLIMALGMFSIAVFILCCLPSSSRALRAARAALLSCVRTALNARESEGGDGIAETGGVEDAPPSPELAIIQLALIF